MQCCIRLELVRIIILSLACDAARSCSNTIRATEGRIEGGMPHESNLSVRYGDWMAWSDPHINGRPFGRNLEVLWPPCEVHCRSKVVM